MRKLLCLVVTVILVMSVGINCIANGETFDENVYKNAEVYQYDKFDNTWNVTNGYMGSDASFVLNVAGNSKGIDYITLLVSCSGIYTISEIDVMINDNTKYSWSWILDSGNIPLGTNGMRLVKELSYAENVSIRYKGSSSTKIVELNGSKIEELKSIAELIINNRSFDYMDNSASELGNRMDNYLTITGTDDSGTSYKINANGFVSDDGKFAAKVSDFKKTGNEYSCSLEILDPQSGISYGKVTITGEDDAIDEIPVTTRGIDPKGIYSFKANGGTSYSIGIGFDLYAQYMGMTIPGVSIIRTVPLTLSIKD